MTADGEQIARLEEQLRGIREDVKELAAETNRSRGRLHKLEGLTALFVETQKLNRQQEERQYRRLGRKIQWASIIIACAAVLVSVVVPILTHVLR